ncbi:WXG100 family type VII secretion target [Nocardia panacis]|uniref:WXG100 family type VII secretion target n=1 Tax=Nocardia panacis TaxID=2340916 RepID=A0A3A4KQE0_9NOCA|nr:WXG100 family type VII secretion target [Nocardia panacis]RJO75220.1 WXG100 family type VII secretion target [Nocardia panacis]
MDGAGGFPDPRRDTYIAPDAVRTYGRNVGGIAKTLQKALDSAAKEVDDLLSRGWSGATAQEFADGWRETHDGGERIVHALRTLAGKLGVGADEYRDREDTSATDIASLRT